MDERRKSCTRTSYVTASEEIKGLDVNIGLYTGAALPCDNLARSLFNIRCHLITQLSVKLPSMPTQACWQAKPQM